MLAPGFPQSLRKVTIGRQSFQRSDELNSITGRYEQAGLAIAHNIRDPAQVTADHRHAVAHRFEQDHAEPFGVAARVQDRRQDQDV